MKSRKEKLEEKFTPLSFGTSGVRALVTDMTDMECYINTRGFVRYLFAINEVEKNGRIAIAGDLRSSTPRIIKAVCKAVIDEGCTPVYCGLVPTPAVSFYAWRRNLPAIMVTGSHIPDDRNGIKFARAQGEVLKVDEKPMLEYVAVARNEEYGKSEDESIFDMDGNFKEAPELPDAGREGEVINEFVLRYASVFPEGILSGKKIVLYEQSAVGRDILKDLLIYLGADVVSIERSDEFIPIDTEKVPGFLPEALKKWAREYKPFAIVSTDGDSDRPFLADEFGRFLPGDLLGTLVSLYLKPDYAVIPISTNDAVHITLERIGTEIELVKIGSPYCISAMHKIITEHQGAKVVSWERNGGYLLGSDFVLHGKKIDALPTRDSILPILISLIFATEENISIGQLIQSKLPHRVINSNAIDNHTKGCESYTAELGKKIIKKFSPEATGVHEINYPSLNEEAVSIKSSLSAYFGKNEGYTEIKSINYIDGVRIMFENRDVLHLRPSSNAPEFRFYVTADTEERAEQMIMDCFAILPKIIQNTATKSNISEF